VFIPEGDAGSRFQILLKFKSLVFIGKDDAGNQVDRKFIHCIMNFSPVMPSDSLLKVWGAAGVVCAIGTAEDVDGPGLGTKSVHLKCFSLNVASREKISVWERIFLIALLRQGYVGRSW